MNKNINNTNIAEVEISEAFQQIMSSKAAKFDETIEIHVKLGVDVKQTDQQVKSTVVLPNGTGKTKKILAIVEDNDIANAKEAGADIAGSAELIQKIQTENWFDFDIIVTTPKMMVQLSKIGRILGPKGLMPTLKTGNVTTNIKQAISEIKQGKIEYKTDKTGVVHTILGKRSFSVEKLVENYNVFLNSLIKAKPSSAKGQYIKSIYVASTMGHGIKVKLNI